MAAMGVVAAAHRKEGRRRWGGVGSGGARRGWGWLAPLAALLLAGGAAALVKEDCLLLNYYPPNSRLGKLDIPDVSSQVTGAFTVEFWYNLFQTRDAVTSGAAWPALGRLAVFYSRDQHAANSGRVFVDTHATDGTLQFEVQGYPAATSTRKLVPRQWHHLAFVYDNTANAGGLSIYIDGALGGSVDFTGTAAAAHGTAVQFNGFTMGYDRPGLTGLYNQAYVRDVRIWSTARTAANIQNNMLNSITSATSGLALSLPLSATTQYADQSGNGFDASDPGNQNIFVGPTPALTVNPGNFITSREGAGFQMNVNGVAGTALRAYYAIVPQGTRQKGWMAEFFPLGADAFGPEDSYHVDVNMMTTDIREVVSTVNYASSGNHFTTTGTIPGGSGVGSRFSCLLSVTSGGTYTFYVNSQDGARLYVDTSSSSTFFPFNQHAFSSSDYLVVDNSGQKSSMVETSGTVTLTANTEYRVYVVHGSNPAATARGLIVSWSGPDTSSTKEVIPDTKTFAGPLAVRWALESGATLQGNFAVAAGGTTATHLVSAGAGLAEGTAYDIYIVSAVERYGSSDNPHAFDPVLSSVVAASKQTTTTLVTPSATTSAVTVAEGGSATVSATNLVITDSDSNDADITVTLAVAPTVGTLKLSGAALAAGGTFTKAQLVASSVTYDHDGSDTTSDTMRFSISDGTHTIANINLAVTVSGSDDPPSVGNTSPSVTVATGSQATLDSTVLTITDSDTADASVTVTITSAPSNGRVELSTNPGGAVTSFTKADVAAGTVRYVHDGGASTSDSLQFTVGDGTTTTSAYTLSITVNSVDAVAPTITVGTLTVAEGGTLTITAGMLSASDAGVDDATIGFTVAMAPSQGRLQNADNPGITIASWTMADISQSKIQYVQTISNKPQDSFQVTATDGSNTGSATTVNINIQAVDNAATTATIGAAFNVNEGATKVIASTHLVITDADTSPSAVTCTVTSATSNGILQLSSARGTAITSFTAAQIAGGNVEYAHDDSETNSDSFQFSCSDGTNGASAGTFSISVVPQNDNTPTINTADVSVNEGQSVQLGVANLQAVDGDLSTSAADLVYTVVTGTPAKGVIQVGGSDVTTFTQDQVNSLQVTYRSTANDGSTSDTITVTVTDGTRTSAPASVAVTIAPIGGNAPTVTMTTDPSTTTIDEGGAMYVLQSQLSAVAASGSVPASSLTYTVQSTDRLQIWKGASMGVTSFTQADINSLLIRLVHDDSESSSASFVFVVDDGAGNSSPALRFNVFVTPFNDNSPVVTTQGFTCTEGATCTITTAFMSATDSDLPKQPLVYTKTGSGPVFGFLQLANSPNVPITQWSQQSIIDGLLQYKNSGAEAQFDSFNIRVSDGENQVTKPFSINIIPVNDAPIVDNNVPMNVDEGGTRSFSSLLLQVRDDDTPEASIVFTVSSGPTYGKILLNNAATVSFTQADLNANPAVVRYLQDGTDVLADSFTFTVTDGNTVLSGTYQITVNPIDDNAPTSVVSGPVTVTEGSSVQISNAELRATDTDTADQAQIIFNIASAPSAGFLQLQGQAGQASSFTQADINANKLSYNHDGSDTQTDTFTYSLTDGVGNALSGAPTSFTINILPVDDSAPTRLRNTGLILQEGETKTITNQELAYTDADTDDGTLVYTVTSAPMFGKVVLSSAPTVAVSTFTQAQIDSSAVQYAHDDSETGSDRFSFRVCDGANNCINSQRFSQTIVLVDDAPPTEVTNTGVTVDEGESVQIGKDQLKYTDIDSNDEDLLFTVVTPPANAIIQVVTSPPRRSLTFSPPPPPAARGAPGSGRRPLDAFWYTLDGHSPNDFVGRRHLLQGSVTFTQRDLNRNAVQIKHDSSETADANFAFKVTDPANNAANGNFAVTVTLVDDEPPVIDVNQPLTVQERGSAPIPNTILAASDPDTPLTRVAFNIEPGFPTGGCFKLAGSCTSTFTQAQIDSGAVSFESDGQATATVQFTVTDGAGHVTSPPAVFVINVVQVDDAPLLTLGSTQFTVVEGQFETITSAYISVADSDSTPTDVVFTIDSGPGHGQLELSSARGTAITSFTLDDLTNNIVIYQHDGSNTVTDAFQFTLSDGTSTLPQTQFPIVITPVDDDPPVVDVNQVLSAREGESTVINNGYLSASDADSPIASIKFIVTSNPAYGQLEIGGAVVTSFTQQDILDGSLVYRHTAANGAATADSFAFTVTDGTNSAPLTTFSISLVDVDDVPPQVSKNEGITCPEGGSRVITDDKLSLSDPDTAGEENWKASVTVPPGVGYLQLTTNPGTPITEFSQADILAGRLQYVHDGSESTSDSFTFVTKDGVNTLATPAVFQITITPVDDDPPTNNAPGFVGSSAAELVVPRGQSRVIGKATWDYIDTDKENSLLAYTVVGPPKVGTFTVNGNMVTSFLQSDVDSGTVKYTHDGSTVFTDTILFTVSDGTVTTQTQTLNLRITDSDTPFVKDFEIVNESETGFDGKLTMSEVSTVYYGLIKCETIRPCTPQCPDSASVIAGNFGGKEVTKGTLDYTTSGSQLTIAFTNLEPATSYKVCISSVDSAGNNQAQTFSAVGSTLGLIAAPDPIYLAEAGGEAPFNVALGVASTADLAVTISVPAAAQANQVEFSLSHSKCDIIPAFCGTYHDTVTFTLPFNEPDFHVTVVAKAVDDLLAEGDHNIAISASYTTTDPTYAGYGQPSDVTAIIADNDVAAVILSPQTQVVDEGSKGTVTVLLGAGPPPGETVTVKLTSGDPALLFLSAPGGDGSSSHTVVLDSSNWQTGVPLDAIARRTPGANDETDVPISVAVQSTVLAYNGLAVENGVVTIQDNTPPGIVLDRNRITLDENTERVEVKVTLSTQPLSLVDVRTRDIDGPAFNVSAPDAGDAICPKCSTQQLIYTPSKLKFAPDTWDVPQTVVVERRSDAVACGTWCTDDCCLNAVSFEVTTAFTGSVGPTGDADYNGTSTNLLADIVDVDRPGIRTSAALSRRSARPQADADFNAVIEKAYGTVLPISSVVDEQGVQAVSTMMNIFEGDAEGYSAVLLTQPSSRVNVTVTVREVTPYLGWRATDPLAPPMGGAVEGGRRHLAGAGLTESLAFPWQSRRSNIGRRHLLQDPLDTNVFRLNRISVKPIEASVLPADWRDGVRFQVWTNDDQTMNGDGLYSIESRTESYDENYNNLQIPRTLVAVVENDLPKIILAPPSLELAGGSTGYVQVQLQSQPLNDVTVDVILPNYMQGWSTVSFNSENWGIVQFVPVRQNLALPAPEDGRTEVCFDVNKALTDDYYYKNFGDGGCVQVQLQSYGCELEGEIGPEGGSLCCPTGSCIIIPPNTLPRTCGVFIKDANTYLDLVSDAGANPECPCHTCHQQGPIVEWGFTDGCTFEAPQQGTVVVPVPNARDGISSPPMYGVYNDGAPEQQPAWDNLGQDAMTSEYDYDMTMHKAFLKTTRAGIFGVMEYVVNVRVVFDPERADVNGDLRLTFTEGPEAVTIDSKLRVEGKPSQGCVVNATVVVANNYEQSEDRLLYGGNDAAVDGGYLAAVAGPDGGNLLLDVAYRRGEISMQLNLGGAGGGDGSVEVARRQAGGDAAAVAPDIPVEIFESALRKVGYLNIDDNPTTTVRQVHFRLSSQYATSDSPAVHISIEPVNDLPNLRLSPLPLEVTEAEMRLIDTGALLYEPDSPSCLGAEIWIEGAARERQTEADILHFVRDAVQADATGSGVLDIKAQFDSETTMMVLSGIAAPSEYQKALRAIAFEQPGPLVNNKAETRIAYMRVKDEYGWGNTEQREIRIKPRTLPPIFSKTDTLYILEDTVGHGKLRAEDPQGLGVFYELVCDPAKGIADVDAQTGDFTYTPYPNENGKDQFLVRANNGEASSPVEIVTVEIEPVNDAPFVKDMQINAYEDEPRVVAFDVVDVDGPDEVDYISIVREPLEPSTLTLVNQSSSDDSLFRKGANAPFTYVVTMTSKAIRSGMDSFQFKAVDKYGAPSDVAIVAIKITRANQNISAPVVPDVTIRLRESSRFNGALTAPGYIEPDYLIYGFTDPRPQVGVISLKNEVSGSYTYTAPPFRNGADSFGYYAEGLYGMRSDAGTVAVEIQSVNDRPQPACGSLSELPSGVYGNFTANVTNTLSPGSDLVDILEDTFASDGHLKYAESAYLLGQLRSLPDKVSLTTQVTYSLASPDHPPLAFVACDDEAEISCDMNATAVVMPVAYDPDEAKALVYSIVELPEHGELYVHDPDAAAGLSLSTKVADVDGSVLPVSSPVVLYRAPPTLRGAPLDTFVWQAVDAEGAKGMAARVHVTVRCAPGYRIGAGAANGTCVPCPAGTFNQAGVLDQEECYECAAGTYSASPGSTRCLACAAGTYGPFKGASACVPCADARMTSRVGATSQDQCACRPGNWQPNATSCAVCGERTICEQSGQELPLPKEGYWVNPRDGFEVLKCFPEKACPPHRSVALVRESNCGAAEGEGDPAYVGVACRKCKDGHYRSAGKCETCPATADANFYLFFCYLLVLCVVLLFVSQAETVFGALNILVNFSQINASMYYFNYDWGTGLTTWFRILSLTNLNVELASPECTLGSYVYLNGFIISLLLPPVYTMLFVLRAGYGIARDAMFSHSQTMHGNPELGTTLIGRISQLLGRPKGESLADFLDRCISANTLFYVWGYYYLGLTALEYFDCQKADGRFSMRAAPDVTCWDWGSGDTHEVLLPFAIAALTLFPFGILAGVSLLLYINRPSGSRAVIGAMRRAKMQLASEGHTTDQALAVKRAKINRFRIRFGFLYRGYEFEWFFFEALTIAFKLCLLLTRFFVSDPMSQGLLNMTLLLARTLFVVFSTPYDRARLDVMEVISSVGNNVVLFIGLVLYSGVLDANGMDALRAVGQIILVLLYVVLGVFVLLDVFPGLLTLYRSYKRALLRATLEGEGGAAALWKRQFQGGNALQRIMGLRAMGMMGAQTKADKAIEEARLIFVPKIAAEFEDYVKSAGDAEIEKAAELMQMLGAIRKAREDRLDDAEGGDSKKQPELLGEPYVRPDKQLNLYNFLAFEAAGDKRTYLINALRLMADPPPDIKEKIERGPPVPERSSSSVNDESAKMAAAGDGLAEDDAAKVRNLLGGGASKKKASGIKLFQVLPTTLPGSPAPKEQAAAEVPAEEDSSAVSTPMKVVNPEDALVRFEQPIVPTDEEPALQEEAAPMPRQEPPSPAPAPAPHVTQAPSPASVVLAEPNVVASPPSAHRPPSAMETEKAIETTGARAASKYVVAADSAPPPVEPQAPPSAPSGIDYDNDASDFFTIVTLYGERGAAREEIAASLKFQKIALNLAVEEVDEDDLDGMAASQGAVVQFRITRHGRKLDRLTMSRLKQRLSGYVPGSRRGAYTGAGPGALRSSLASAQSFAAASGQYAPRTAPAGGAASRLRMPSRGEDASRRADAAADSRVQSWLESQGAEP